MDYQTYCKIRDHFDRQGLTIAQTARALGLHPQTVSKWARIEQYRPRRAAALASLLDPYKGLIVRWLDAHPLSAQQVFQRLREADIAGGRTIVHDYVHRIRPRRAEGVPASVLRPGRVRTARLGRVRLHRRGFHASTLVASSSWCMCYSRLMYVEFTVSQTMEHFLACHENAFTALGGA